MTIGAATESELGGLHNAISRRLTKAVDDDESDPRYVQMAIKFCSDNKITVVPNQSNELGKTIAALENRKKRIFKDNVTDLATKVAERLVKEG